MGYTFSQLTQMAGQINNLVCSEIHGAITDKGPDADVLSQQGISWGSSTDLEYYAEAINAIDKSSAKIPAGSKFAYSVWGAIPQEVASYVQQSSTNDCSNMFSNCVDLSSVGTSTTPFLLSGKGSIERIFQNCTNLRTVFLRGSQEWLNGSRAFQGCVNLNTVSFASIPANPVNLESMFEGCSSLTGLVDIKLTNEQGVDCDYMYKSSGLLVGIPSTFADESTNINSAEEMFQDCALPSVGDMFLEKCASCRGMFQITTSGKAQLLTVGSLSTKSCINMNYMFAGQVQLTSINSIDMSSCQTAIGIFQGCNNITTLIIKNLGGNGSMQELDLSQLTNWTNGVSETITSAANRLNLGNFTLKLSSTTKNSLTEEQINTLINKGYTII